MAEEAGGRGPEDEHQEGEGEGGRSEQTDQIREPLTGVRKKREVHLCLDVLVKAQDSRRNQLPKILELYVFTLLLVILFIFSYLSIHPTSYTTPLKGGRAFVSVRRCSSRT